MRWLAGDGKPWFLKRPWGFVARARFEQIDTERRAWQRWCEEAESKIADRRAS